MSDAVLFRQDLQSSVDNGRLGVMAGVVTLEDADAGPGALDAKVVAQMTQGAGATLAQLPYTTVNALEKTMDTVLAVPDARGQGRTEGEGQGGKLQSRLAK